MPRRKGKPNAGRESPKPPLTHFLCLPLITPASLPQLETSLKRFQEEVCNESPPKTKTASEGTHVAPSVMPASENTQASVSISEAQSTPGVTPTSLAETAIRPVGSLHLTLGVMSLDDDQLATAKEILQGIEGAEILRRALCNSPETNTASVEKISKTGRVGVPDAATENVPMSFTRAISPPTAPDSRRPLVISLKSLVSMHDPRKTSILYAAPNDPSNRLQRLCETFREHFLQAKLLIDDNRPLKLHATIVNTIYAKRGKKQGGEEDSSNGHGPEANALLKIDATSIIDRYQDYIWADSIALDRIAICEMGVKKILNEDGRVVREEYKEVACIPLPSA